MDEFFAVEWPALSRRIGRRLAVAGVPPWDREDVLQETALRLVRYWQRIEAGRPVEPLARTIALNVWRNRLAAACRRELLVEPPPVACWRDVEHEVLTRAELARVRTAFAGLAPAYQGRIRDAVAADLDGVSSPRSAAQRMALMRARRHLVAALAATRRAARTSGGLGLAADGG